MLFGERTMRIFEKERFSYRSGSRATVHVPQWRHGHVTTTGLKILSKIFSIFVKYSFYIRELVYSSKFNKFLQAFKARIFFNTQSFVKTKQKSNLNSSLRQKCRLEERSTLFQQTQLPRPKSYLSYSLTQKLWKKIFSKLEISLLAFEIWRYEAENLNRFCVGKFIPIVKVIIMIK